MKRKIVARGRMLLLALALLAGVPATAQTPPAVDAPEATQLDSATRRAYRHVFIAFAVAWVLMLGYVAALDRRYRALERELEGEPVTG